MSLNTEVSTNFKIVDFHTHIYPDLKFRNQIPENYLQKAKSASKYYSLIGHALQQKIHLVPENIRKHFDSVLLPFTLPTLAVNSTADDLLSEIKTHSLAYVVTAAHPPAISNEFIFEQSQKNTQFIPCLSYTESEKDADYFEIPKLAQPQFLLKLYPMAEDFNLNSSHLEAILELWNKNSWPMLVHTGALYSSFFKKPTAGQIENLTQMVKKYKNIKFILLHMNIFKPYEAIEFCQKFENTFVTISWQSEELITIANKKLGSEKLLFSSDWPLLGNNIELRKNMILTLFEKNYISVSDCENIFYNNARNILENYFSKIL